MTSSLREELLSGEHLERREELGDLLEEVGHREDLFNGSLFAFFIHFIRGMKLLRIFEPQIVI